MDFQEFKNYNIRQKIGIDEERFGKVFVFVDFANVDKWFAEDDRDWNKNVLENNKKLSIDLEKLLVFTKCFSDHVRFYYGHNPQNVNSLKFLGKTKYVFGENMVFTKPIQQVKHHLDEKERIINTRQIRNDNTGDFIYLPKCNFDVEICVDAIRLMSRYDTFCLFSSDSDFVSLIKFLKNNRKKVILIKGGYVQHALKANSDLVINAQDIKSYVACIKQKSSFVG
ncbi:MAG: NYN domain-containing protein [Candidatus Magasanikbacteria bacterium]|nr:NYN domain-containing protein [Candidatus Magasanikbacteria bacterium]